VKDPEDLLSEVLLQVVKGLERFEGDERSFRTWVLTIAHRRLVDDIRKATRSRETPVPPEGLMDRAADADVEQEVTQSLEAERAARMMRELAPDQQDVLLLRLFAGLTVDEVAQVVGKRPGAVKALQRRGLASLRKKLSKEGVPL
jgi:RNA polymerase sigma-70 factor (ECF subfamily)